MTEPQLPAAGRRRWVSRLALMAFGSALGMVCVELGLRALTSTGPGGSLRIGRTLLAPIELQTVEEARQVIQADDSYLVPDPLLGWSLRPGGRDRKLKLYAANSLGLRSLPREDSPAPAPGVFRVLTVGDSFTHCDQVEYSRSWTHLLEQRLGERSEVLNGGVPGFGNDQALLRFRSLAPSLRPHLAIFGVILEDAFRNVNIFRTLEYASTSFPFAKPRFVLAGESLRLINSPVIGAEDIPQVLRSLADHPLRPHEYWYLPALYDHDLLDTLRTYRYLRSRLIWRERARRVRAALAPDSEALRVTARIARTFCDEARALGIKPLVVILPSVKDLAELKAGVNPWAALEGELSRAGVGEVELLPKKLLAALGQQEPMAFYVDGDGHLNGAGNGAVADILAPIVGSLRPER